MRLFVATSSLRHGSLQHAAGLQRAWVASLKSNCSSGPSWQCSYHTAIMLPLSLPSCGRARCPIPTALRPYVCPPLLPPSLWSCRFHAPPIPLRRPAPVLLCALQEEERERRMDFIPDESAINTDAIEVDKDTMDMLRGMNMAGLPGITVQQVREEGRDGGRVGRWGYVCRMWLAWWCSRAGWNRRWAPLHAAGSRAWAAGARAVSSVMCAGCLVLLVGRTGRPTQKTERRLAAMLHAHRQGTCLLALP